MWQLQGPYERVARSVARSVIYWPVRYRQLYTLAALRSPVTTVVTGTSRSGPSAALSGENPLFERAVGAA